MRSLSTGQLVERKERTCTSRSHAVVVAKDKSLHTASPFLLATRPEQHLLTQHVIRTPYDARIVYRGTVMSFAARVLPSSSRLCALE